jgi:hypothetical protein
MGFCPISNFPFPCHLSIMAAASPFWDDYGFAMSAHPIAQNIDPANAHVLRN